jgi:hypothetical protein
MTSKVVVSALFAVRCWFFPNHVPAPPFARHNVRSELSRLVCGIDTFAEDLRDLYARETNFRGGSNLHDNDVFLEALEKGARGTTAVPSPRACGPGFRPQTVGFIGDLQGCAKKLQLGGNRLSLKSRALTPLLLRFSRPTNFVPPRPLAVEDLTLLTPFPDGNSSSAPYLHIQLATVLKVPSRNEV